MNTQDEQVLSSLVKDYEDVNEQLERLAEKKSGLRRIILDMLRRIHGDDEVDWTDGNYILNRDFRHSEIIDLDILQDLLQPQQYLDITDEERKNQTREKEHENSSQHQQNSRAAHGARCSGLYTGDRYHSERVVGDGESGNCHDTAEWILLHHHPGTGDR